MKAYRLIVLIVKPVVLTFFFSNLTFALAQGTFTVTITGTVADAQGALIADATVTATNLAIGVQKTVKPNAERIYTIPFLQPGVYKVSAEAAGFQKFISENIKLEVAQTAELNITLAASGTTEQVTVTGTTTPLLVTEQSSVDQAIEPKQVEDLPVLERNVFALVTILPGVVAVSNIGAVANRNVFDANFSVNGGRASTNEVLIDGVTDTIGDFNGIVIVPPVDSVQEFKMQSGSFSAEYGRSGGGVLNLITKSGGNRLHGNLYEFLQNNALNANGWARNRNNLSRIAGAQRHHFGGAIGGPVWIPKLYKGTNKTFFFFDYEAQRENDPASLLATVPTLAMRRGDFSEVVDASGNPILIFNPFSAHTVGGRIVRDPFAGSRIPSSLINPVAAQIIKFWPEPNRAGITNNFAASGTNRLTKDLFDARIDHNVSQKQKFFWRISIEERFNDPANLFGTPAFTDNKVKDHYRNFVFDHVYSISNHVINDFRYGYTRFRANQIPQSLRFDPVSLGFPSLLRENAKVLEFPDISIGGKLGVRALGGDYNNQPRDTHALVEAVTIVKGKHTIKPGFECRLLRFMSFQIVAPTGSFSFDDRPTTGPSPDVISTMSGIGFASFLLGLPSSGSFEFAQPLTIFHHYYAGYIQDDFKVTQRLTLNLGLRWDVETGTAETHNRMAFFLANEPSPLAGKVSGFGNLRGLLQFTGNGNPRTGWNASKKRFSPRFGLAYRIGADMVVRMGYGVFFLPMSLEAVGATGFNFSASLVQDVNNPTTTLSNPFPNGFPTPGNQGPLTLIGESINVQTTRRDVDSPYNQMWNVAVQRQLARNLVVEAAYVGSQGVHLPMQTLNINQLDPSFLSLRAALNTRVPNPFFGIIPPASSAVGASTVPQVQLLKPFPQYNNVFLIRPNVGSSLYHSLQLKLEKRFSSGVSALVSYTASKLLDMSGTGNGAAFLDASSVQDVYNLAAERSVSSNDVPQIFVAVFNYELPFGRGNLFGKGSSSILNGLFSGWQINGIMRWQRGRPLGVTASGTLPSQAGFASLRANVVPGEKVSIGLSQARKNARQGLPWFNTKAFAVPPPFSLGNAGRRIPDLRTDNFKNFDFSIFKDWRTNETTKLQFRAEFYNLFNQVVFGTPATAVGTTTFGIVTSQANDPRKIQLALRFTF